MGKDFAGRGRISRELIEGLLQGVNNFRNWRTGFGIVGIVWDCMGLLGLLGWFWLTGKLFVLVPFDVWKCLGLSNVDLG